MFIRLKNGELFQVKPGTEILCVEFKMNKDYRFQFISELTDRMINIPCAEVERIFLQ